MPGTWVALLVGVALVPGFLFLELTAGRRQPRSRSSLGEVLLVLAVGLPTTGLSLLVVALACPGRLAGAIGSWTTSSSAPSETGIRASALVLLVIVVLATAIAWLLALLVKRFSTRRFASSVRVGVLAASEAPEGKKAFLRVVLDTGEAVSGFLLAYEDSAGGDIALSGPISRWKPRERKVELPLDRVIICGEQISMIQLSYQDPAPAPATTSGGGHPASPGADMRAGLRWDGT